MPEEENTTGEETATSAAPRLNDAWVTYISPFAGAIELSPDEVTERLAGLVGKNPGCLAIRALKAGTPETVEKVRRALDTVPELVLNEAYEEYLRERATPVVAPTPAVTVTRATFTLLPEVPTDDDWLAALRTSGVLYVGSEVVIAGIKAALAKRAGLYELPDKIVGRMLQFAKDQKRAVSPEYWTLRAMLTRRTYGDLFQAIEGVDGTYATETRRRDFLKLIEGLWAGLAAFNRQLKEWNDLYIQSGSSPQAMLAAVSAITGGAPMAANYPPVAPLKDEAEVVVERINEAFAGDGVPVAMALAYEAKLIRDALRDPRLPGQLGMAGYDIMLREFQVDVPAADIRAEKSIVRFTLGVMKLPEIDAGMELQYVLELMQLGASIPWERLLTPTETTRATAVRRPTGHPNY